MSGLIGALAAVRCGTTTLIDHHASPNAIDGSLRHWKTASPPSAAAACCAMKSPTAIGRMKPRRAWPKTSATFAHCQQRQASGSFAGMVGGHASFTMDEESLAGCVELAQAARRRRSHPCGRGPGRRANHSRAIWLRTDRAIRTGWLVGRRRARSSPTARICRTPISRPSTKDASIALAHNPSSNMNNGVGYTPVAKFARPPQLGTDGIGADMWREARVAEFKSHDAAALPVSPFGHDLAPNA